MPWGELKKEDLMKAGLDPDAFKAMGDKIATAATKDDLTELKNSVATTQETLKNLEATLRTAMQASTGRGEGGERQDQDPDQNQDKGRQQGPQPVNIDPLAFMEDPQGAVRRIMNEAMAPVTLHSLSVAADMAYNIARQRLPYFEKFEPEIKELWNKYTPAQKGKPDELIENLYNLVRGRHMDEILTDTNKKDGKYNLVSSGGSSNIGKAGAGVGDTSGGRKPEDDLTEQEKSVAARFGLTPAEWAAQKAGLKYV